MGGHFHFMIFLMYGLPGTGKTTLQHDLIAGMAHRNRFFVRDKADEWLPGAFHWRGNNNLPITVCQPGSLPSIEKMEPTGIFVFPSTYWSPEEITQLTVDYGNTCYVDDEIDSYARVQGWRESPLRGIVHEGRHQKNRRGEICRNHIIGACRRPQNLVTDLTDIVDQVFLFRVKGVNTKKRLLGDSVIEDETEWQMVRRFPNFYFRHTPSEQNLMVKPLGDVKQDSLGQLPENEIEDDEDDDDEIDVPDFT